MDTTVVFLMERAKVKWIVYNDTFFVKNTCVIENLGV